MSVDEDRQSQPALRYVISVEEHRRRSARRARRKPILIAAATVLGIALLGWLVFEGLWNYQPLA